MGRALTPPASTATAAAAFCGSINKLSGGGAWGPVGPTRPVCVRKIPHGPKRGVGRPARADPPPSKHEVEVPFPASLCLPSFRLVAVCLGSVLVFVLGNWIPLSRQGRGVNVWGRRQPNHV
eukprot:scaffold362_cov127-Isochrysis_galbana.AAC.2